MRRISRHTNKRLIFLSFIAILTIFIVAAVLYAQHKVNAPRNSPNSSAQSDTETPTASDVRLRFAAMGDMLAHDTIIKNARTANGYDFSRYFQMIRPLYKDADVVFCNQEGPSAGTQFGISGYPSFNAPAEFASGLEEGAGCNFINLANNHMGDKGVGATNATIDQWGQLSPLAISGANKTIDEQSRVSYADIKGIRIALLSFADFNNNQSTPSYSVNLYHDESLVRSLVGEARAQADLVILSMHWGTEGSAAVNTDQQSQVELLSSLGVDMIIGTGPHVLQKVETIERPDGGQMTVWYSLGNMLSSQLNIPELFSGIARFEVVKRADGPIRVENLSFYPTYMHYEWTSQQKATGDLSARKNAMLYPLAEAADPLSRSLLNTSVEVQRQYIIDTLGPLVTVK